MNHNRFPGAKYANIFSYKRTTISDGYEDIDEQTLLLVKEILDIQVTKILKMVLVVVYSLAIGTQKKLQIYGEKTPFIKWQKTKVKHGILPTTPCLFTSNIAMSTIHNSFKKHC